MKKIIYFLLLITLVSCGLEDNIELNIVDNKINEFKESSWVTNIIDQEKIELKSNTWSIELFENKEILCSNLISSTDINKCLDENFKIIDKNYFKINWNNNCKELFDSTLYGEDNKVLVEEFYDICSEIYKSSINEVTNVSISGIDECDIYDSESYEMYDDEITWLSSFEICKFEIAFHSLDWCDILKDETEILKCNNIKLSIDEYRNRQIEKQYYEIFNK